MGGRGLAGGKVRRGELQNGVRIRLLDHEEGIRARRAFPELRKIAVFLPGLGQGPKVQAQRRKDCAAAKIVQGHNFRGKSEPIPKPGTMPKEHPNESIPHIPVPDQTEPHFTRV
jgi:hypothetical protein